MTKDPIQAYKKDNSKEKTMRKKSGYLSEFIPESFLSLRKGYSFSLFRKDLLAGLTVGVVALPLAMAFAIASGVTPERGLITAVVAGFLISFLGGSKVQIGGPTGAFVVIIYDIIQRQGYEGLVLATLLASVILLVVAFCRLGSLIKFIPYPLVTGFTTGIALLIFTSQIKNFFGLKIAEEPSAFIDKWPAYFSSASTWSVYAVVVSLSTLLIILMLRRFAPRLPWGILSIGFVTLVSVFLKLPVDTIASSFGEIPRSFPLPSLSVFHFRFEDLSILIPDAITIAFLAGIESLLSAVVADGMTGGRHRSNTELFGQGIANIGSVIFGGIPATGAIARTATNVKTGACTPVAGMIHAAAVFAIVFFFAPQVSLIPLPALAAVLMVVAWNMSEIHHFRHLFNAPKGDIVVLLSAFFLTVFVDLTVAVEVGMILAAFLFMKRMSDVSKITSLSPIIEQEMDESVKIDSDAIQKKKIPHSVEVYEINGPFFFGIADSLKVVLDGLERPPKVFILRMRKVSVIDATGLHALNDFVLSCEKNNTVVFLSGVKSHVKDSIRKYGLLDHVGEENVFYQFDSALKRAAELVKAL